jgi:hypothetical protein
MQMIEVDTTGNALSLQVSGALLLFVILFIGGYIGWWRGFRAFLTVTLVSAFAYILFVDGGSQLLVIINNIWSNIPRLIALFTGNDPVATPAWPPLIPAGGFQIPLTVRVLLFLVSLALAGRFNRQPWYGTNVKEPYAREVGIFTGALTALIWVSAATLFWVEYVNQEGAIQGLLSWLNPILGIIPDVSAFVLPLIGGLVLFLGAGLALKFPKLLRP